MILSDPNASAKVIAGGLLHARPRRHRTKVIGMDGRRDAVAAIRWRSRRRRGSRTDRSASAPLPARTLERAGDTAHLVAAPLPTVKIGRYTDPVPGTEVVKGTGIAVPQFTISTSPAPHTPHKPKATCRRHRRRSPRARRQTGPLPPAHCASRPGDGRFGGRRRRHQRHRSGADVGTTGASAAGRRRRRRSAYAPAAAAAEARHGRRGGCGAIRRARWCASPSSPL